MAQPKRNATLPLKGTITLDSLTNYVHRNTGIRFSFNSAKVKGNKLITFPAKNYTIDQLLKHLQQATSLYYFSYKSYIIFQETPPKHKQTTPVAIATHQPSKTTKQPSIIQKKKTTVAPANVAKQTPKVDTVKKDSAIISVNEPAAPVVIDSTPKKDTTARIVTVAKTKPDTLQERVKKTDSIPAISNKSIHLHAQAGVFSTETLYANAGVEIGIQQIHLLFSMATNFDVSGPRIGLGSVIINHAKTQWQVQASLCFLEKTAPIDSFGTNIDFTTKGKLYSAGIEWCRKLSSHFTFKAGASFNLLRTTYYRFDAESPVGYILPPDEDGDKKFELLKIPAMLSNNYDKYKPSNNKTWIGLSVGVYYNLRYY